MTHEWYWVNHVFLYLHEHQWVPKNLYSTCMTLTSFLVCDFKCKYLTVALVVTVRCRGSFKPSSVKAPALKAHLDGCLFSHENYHQSCCSHVKTNNSHRPRAGVVHGMIGVLKLVTPRDAPQKYTIFERGRSGPPAETQDAASHLFTLSLIFLSPNSQ